MAEVAKGTSRPYYLVAKGLKPSGVFVREGSASVPASPAAIIKMIKESDGDIFENARSLEQELTFRYTENEFKKRGVSFGSQQKKTLHVVNADGLYTNLAFLLSDQCRHSVKLAVNSGKDKIIFQDRAEFSGSIFQQMNDAYDYICKYNKLGARIRGLYRIDTRDYPDDALRESLINAIMHRDYAFNASILVSIFDDRIEFISVGSLVAGMSYNDMMLGVSMQRNENLANVLYRLQLVESYGTGIPRIMNAYKNFSVQPKIEVSDNAFKITLPNMNASVPKQQQLTEKHVTAEKDSAKSMQEVINFLSVNKFITRLEVEDLLDVSQATAARLLKKMCDSNLLLVQGSGKNRCYVLP